MIIYFLQELFFFYCVAISRVVVFKTLYTNNLSLEFVMVVFYFVGVLASGCSHDKVTLSKLTHSNLLGWLTSMKVCHPSLPLEKDLKQVYEYIDSIKFVGELGS